MSVAANDNNHAENAPFLPSSNDGPDQPQQTQIPLTTTTRPQSVVQYKYVDQNGNPVSPPTQTVVVPTQTVVVTYVDQNGNPTNPPPTVVVNQQHNQQTQINQQQKEPVITDAKAKRKQLITMSIGLTTALLWIIGLSIDSLATSSVGDATCGFSEYRVGDIATSYSDLCDLEYESSYNSYGSDDDLGSWCSMATIATMVYIFMIGSLVMVLFGIITVQPWIHICLCTHNGCCKEGCCGGGCCKKGCCKCKRFCCTETWFTLSGTINFLALFFWFIDTGRQCYGEMYSSWGGSIVCFLIGAIFVCFGESAARLLPRI